MSRDQVDLYIGIVENESDGSISIGLIDTANKKISSTVFPPDDTPIVNVIDSDGSLSLTPDMTNLFNFFRQNIPINRRIRILMECEQTFHMIREEDLFEESYFLGAVRGSASILKALLCAVATEAFPISFSLSNDGEICIINPKEYLPQKVEYVLCLKKGLISMYCDFILNPGSSSIDKSFIAAFIAKNRGAYFFLSAPYNHVFSSQDIVTYFSLISILQDQVSSIANIYAPFVDNHLGYPLISMPQAVMSEKVKCTVYFTTATTTDRIETISRKYAVTAKKYESLGEDGALKAALLHVCKNWNIALSCEELNEFLNLDLSTHNLVFPISLTDTWIIHGLSNTPQ